MTHGLLTDEFEAPSAGALFLPLVSSLLVTGAVAALLCQPPAHPLPWPALLALAAGYLAIAALAHAGAVWLAHRIFQDFLPWPTRTFVIALWSTVVWLPLLSLLTSQQSLWVAGTLPLITNYAVQFLAQSRAGPEPDAQEPLPFLVQMGPPFWRALLPAVAASAALEGGVVALVAEHTWLAGLLFAAALSLPVWRLVPVPAPALPGRRRRLLRVSLVAWLLTAIALTPFAVSGLVAHALLRAHAGVPALPAALRASKKVLAGGKGGLYFVVLTQPARPRSQVIPRPAIAGGHGMASVRIPFDGDYWFFKHPGERPGAAARRERGDPEKSNIRSTDQAPMLMEAHQHFLPPLPLGSAKALEVELTNADDRPGLIYAEVLLQTLQGGRGTITSLGTQTLATSKDRNPVLGRAPVPETLHFPIPPSTGKGQVTAFTLQFKSDPSRSLAAPMVHIRNLILQP